MMVNASLWISLWPSFWPRALMGLNGTRKSKGAWTPLARSSVQIRSSGQIRTWDIKQQLFYGVNFYTEDFKRLILLGSLFAKWFFPGCCFILLQRPMFILRVSVLCQTWQWPYDAWSCRTAWPRGLQRGAQQGWMSSAGSGQVPQLRTEIKELKRREMSQKNNVSSAFSSHYCTRPSPGSELLDPCSHFASALCEMWAHFLISLNMPKIEFSWVNPEMNYNVRKIHYWYRPWVWLSNCSAPSPSPLPFSFPSPPVIFWLSSHLHLLL